MLQIIADVLESTHVDHRATGIALHPFTANDGITAFYYRIVGNTDDGRHRVCPHQHLDVIPGRREIAHRSLKGYRAGRRSNRAASSWGHVPYVAWLLPRN